MANIPTLASDSGLRSFFLLSSRKFLPTTQSACGGTLIAGTGLDPAAAKPVRQLVGVGANTAPASECPFAPVSARCRASISRIALIALV
jgi:hypothetical protein